MLQAEPMRRCRLHQCQAACCLHGVWLDLGEVDALRLRAPQIAPFLPPARRDPQGWFTGQPEEDPHSPSGQVLHSSVLPTPWHYGGTACVFLRRDFKCALQTAAHSAGLHPWAWKPFYCILHPLDLDDQGRITLDDTALLLDEPGSCLRPSPTPLPLLATFEEELRYFMGDAAFEALARQQGLPISPSQNPPLAP